MTARKLICHRPVRLGNAAALFLRFEFYQIRGPKLKGCKTISTALMICIRARAVRFSSDWETTEADWDALADALAKVHAEVHPAKA